MLYREFIYRCVSVKEINDLKEQTTSLEDILACGRWSRKRPHDALPYTRFAPMSDLARIQHLFLPKDSISSNSFSQSKPTEMRGRVEFQCQGVENPKQLSLFLDDEGSQW